MEILGSFVLVDEVDGDEERRRMSRVREVYIMLILDLFHVPLACCVGDSK